MTWIILGSVASVTTTALYLLLFGIGTDLGRQKEVWVRLWHLGWKDG